jgi:ribA/ribD-fused uncharacterized protein
MILFNERTQFNCFTLPSPHIVIMHGEEFKTAAHYFYARQFRRTSIERAIRTAKTSKEVRQIWKNNKHKRIKNWHEIQDHIMFTLQLSKFRGNKEIKKILINTKEERLVYDSKNSHWGCGKSGRGKNMLGVMLMKVREVVRQETIYL